MSYTRERKVTSIVKDLLVWIPVGSELTTDMELADSASLAEAGLCSLEELQRLRLELQAAMCEIDRLHVFEENAESADAARKAAEQKLAAVIEHGRLDLYRGKPSDPKVWTFTSKCCSVCNSAGPIDVTAIGREDMYIAMCDACLARVSAALVVAEREACCEDVTELCRTSMCALFGREICDCIRARGAK